MIKPFVLLFFFKNIFYKNIINNVSNDFIFNKELNIKLKHLDNHNFTKLNIYPISNNSLYFTNTKFRKVIIKYNTSMLSSKWYPRYNYESPILFLDYVINNNISNFNYSLIEMYKTNYYHNEYIKPFDNVNDLKEFLILYFNMFRIRPTDRYYIQQKQREFEKKI
jgi:hypothetical protein